VSEKTVLDTLVEEGSDIAAKAKVKYDEASTLEKGGVLAGLGVLAISFFSDPIAAVTTGVAAVLGYKWLNNDDNGNRK
jgi:hypothetical protein